jgi:hypothetical protein
VFIHHETNANGAFLISQAAHQAMAWQLSEHWGNRNFLRPTPRAEVLAAVFLHDVGWFDFDREPGLDENGRPITFDRMVVKTHLQIWRDSILRTAAHSRYAGLLVAAHFGRLIEQKLRDQKALKNDAGVALIEAYECEMSALQDKWTTNLAEDPRFEPFLDGTQREKNSLILAACDQISVFLCADLGSQFDFEATKRDGSTEKIIFKEISDRCWRVRPWPFQGDVLRLHAEAQAMPATNFSSKQELKDMMENAPIERLSFEILRSSRQHG